MTKIIREKIQLKTLFLSSEIAKSMTAIPALTDFYTALTRTLVNIDVDKILKRKNPYLYRAKGINSPGQMIYSLS